MIYMYTGCSRIKTTMSLKHTIKVVLSLLHHSNVPISAFLNHIFKEALVSKAENDSVYTWAFPLVKTKLAEEIVELSGHQHGLHFNASKATSTTQLVQL